MTPSISIWDQGTRGCSWANSTMSAAQLMGAFRRLDAVHKAIPPTPKKYVSLRGYISPSTALPLRDRKLILKRKLRRKKR